MFSWFFHYLLNKNLIKIVQKSFKAHLSRIIILFSHKKDLAPAMKSLKFKIPVALQNALYDVIGLTLLILSLDGDWCQRYVCNK